jgi:hypothetical protein
VLIAMLLHGTNDAVGGSYASQLFDDADLFRLGLLSAAAWWLIAAAVIVCPRSGGSPVPDEPTTASLNRPHAPVAIYRRTRTQRVAQPVGFPTATPKSLVITGLVGPRPR